MKIKKKMLVISFFTIFTLTIITCLLFYFSFFGYVNRHKDEEILKSFYAVETIINNEQNELHKKIIDWSNWDDTYNYMIDRNEEYIHSNLDYNTLKNLNINAVYFLDTNGNIVYQKENELDKNTSDLLLKNISSINNSDKQGLLTFNNKTFIIESSKIINSDETATPNGTIIFI
jgi:sensor domain CHASE-containing protein